jgi:GTP cyclohydrolase I
MVIVEAIEARVASVAVCEHHFLVAMEEAIVVYC